jgi:hypothetical protein
MKIYKEKHVRYGFADENDGWRMKTGLETGRTYIGPICTHFGKTYGTDVMSAHAERNYELYQARISDEINSEMTFEYDKLKPPYSKGFNFPKEYVHILTQKEIDKGEYSRYFVQYQDLVYEVNKRMWKYYSALKTPYHNAVLHAEIKMSLSVFSIDKNKAEINKAAKTMPGVMLKIFPHDNMDIAENLETDGGDLQYDNGEEYIGPYHIHPQNGPMEGARHTSKPHAYLYWQTKEQYRPEGLV